MVTPTTAMFFRVLLVLLHVSWHHMNVADLRTNHRLVDPVGRFEVPIHPRKATIASDNHFVTAINTRITMEFLTMKVLSVELLTMEFFSMQFMAKLFVPILFAVEVVVFPNFPTDTMPEEGKTDTYCEPFAEELQAGDFRRSTDL